MGDSNASLRGLLAAGAVEILSCERELGSAESAFLEAALQRLRLRRRPLWGWTAIEDKKLKIFIRKRARIGRPKPFQPNDEVRMIAADMGRTYMAVHRRIERLRKQMKCSDAKRRAKG